CTTPGKGNYFDYW
nr:immunoglobulin heavy chain junction region [Mus musculus]MBK4189636.1 immunoglobulin heavy chain junction region [Mus musculus]